MVKATAPLHDGSLLVLLGVEEENLRRLRQGQPIDVDMGQLALPTSRIGRVVVFYGATAGELARMMKTFIGPETVVKVEAPGPAGVQ